MLYPFDGSWFYRKHLINAPSCMKSEETAVQILLKYVPRSQSKVFSKSRMLRFLKELGAGVSCTHHTQNRRHNDELRAPARDTIYNTIPRASLPCEKAPRDIPTTIQLLNMKPISSRVTGSDMVVWVYGGIPIPMRPTCFDVRTRHVVHQFNALNELWNELIGVPLKDKIRNWVTRQRSPT